MGNNMKRIDLRKIGILKGKMHQILETGKTFLNSSSTHENSENDPNCLEWNRLEWSRSQEAFLAQVESDKAKAVFFMERQRNRFA
jgi:hypothetical protein